MWIHKWYVLRGVPATGPSAPSKARLSFLLEGSQGLHVVVGLERHDLERGRRVECGVDGVLDEFVHGEFRVPHRQRGSGGKALRKGRGLFVELLRGGDEIDETDALGLARRDRVAGHEVLLCPRGAEQERPDRRTPVSGDDPNAHVGVGENRLFRSKNDVRKERERSAETDGGAVHGRDDRKLDLEQVPDELLAVTAHLLEDLGLLQLGKPVEVTSGRERLAFPREKDRSRLVLSLQLAKQQGEFAVENTIDRIHRA